MQNKDVPVVYDSTEHGKKQAFSLKFYQKHEKKAKNALFSFQMDESAGFLVPVSKKSLQSTAKTLDAKGV